MEIEIYIQTNKVGSRCSKIIEVDDEEWEAMDEIERGEYCFDVLGDSGLFSWGWEKKK